MKHTCRRKASNNNFEIKVSIGASCCCEGKARCDDNTLDMERILAEIQQELASESKGRYSRGL